MARLLQWSVKDVREIIQSCVYNKFDFIAFVEGKRGLGKSTLIYKILNGLELPIPFKPRRDIVYERTEILRHLATKKGGCVFADEMVNVSYNRDFYIEEQKTLIKAFNMYRDSCNVFIGAIPKFIDLDIQIQRLCKLRITVVRRGIAIIHAQRPSIYLTDVWDIKNNQKIESNWTLKGSKNPRYARLTTVVGILKFGDLTAQQREEYEAIKQEKRGKVFGQYSDIGLMNDPEKLFYNGLIDMMKQGKLSPESLEVASKVHGKDITTVRTRLNKMLKEQGEDKRTKDYVMNPKKKQKKDLLGFQVNNDAE